jgi:hypothetical protein
MSPEQPSGKKPIEDAVLGRLTWDGRFNEWGARFAVTPGLLVEVCLTPAGDEADDVTVARGRDFVHWLRQNEPAARRFAAAELLDVFNGAWNDGEPLSAQAFADRITLGTAGVTPDGGAVLYYEDGDLFAGHCVIVSVSEVRAFTHAAIAG